MSQHTIWTQWDDLNVPSKFKRLSPSTTPIENADLSEITFYVPIYMGGRPALELTKKMPNLKILQMPNAGYDDAMEYVRDGMTLCNGKSIHDDSTAELAVGLTIASLRGFPDFIRNQDKSDWVHVKNKSINDITGSMMSAQLFEERLNNLQKRNPDKPLEDVYKNNTNVLNMVQKFRNGLKESKGSMDEYTNTSFYSLISLNGNVSSEKKLLKLVDQTLKTCDTLDKESASLP